MLDLLLSTVTAVATVAIAAAAWRQLPLLTEQVKSLSNQVKQSREFADGAAAREQKAVHRQREMRTVEVVERCDSDPVFEAASKRVWEASNGGEDYTKADRRDIIVITNYFSTLATGIKQGIYIEEIVKDSLKSSIKKVVEKFLHTGMVDKEEHKSLLSLYSDWFPESSDTEYKTK